MPSSNFELQSHDVLQLRAKTVLEPEHIRSRLGELSPHLSAQLVSNAIVSGLSARNDTTRASAVTAPGLQQWLKTVETLRLLLSESLWHIHDEFNCPFISSPDRSVSIVVMTGCSETGKIGFQDPTNQAEKGAVVKDFVLANRQAELCFHDAVKAARAERSDTQVWVLLYHYDKGSNEVRFELSYPTKFDRKKIVQWGERIIFGGISNDPNGFTIVQDIPNSPATVEVEPKTGTY